MHEVFDALNIILVGDEKVGKTALKDALFGFKFNKNVYQPTIGADHYSTLIKVVNIKRKLGIWDTAGQLRFRSLIPGYFQNINAAIFVFDFSNKDSFLALEALLEKCQEKAPKAKIVLVGNKYQNENNAVSDDDVAAFLLKHEKADIHFFKTNVETNLNVKEPFYTAAKLALDLDPRTNEVQEYNPVVEQRLRETKLQDFVNKHKKIAQDNNYDFSYIQSIDDFAWDAQEVLNSQYLNHEQQNEKIRQLAYKHFRHHHQNTRILLDALTIFAVPLAGVGLIIMAWNYNRYGTCFFSRASTKRGKEIDEIFSDGPSPLKRFTEAE